MRTGLQALLSTTALAGAIAVATLVSSGSARFANADVVTDTVRDTLTALMRDQGAALPEATRTAVSATLSNASDSADLVAQLNGLAAHNAALADTIGAALGKASLSLQLSDVSAASQLHSYVSSASNANVVAGYNAAKAPITAQSQMQSQTKAVGLQVAQSTDTDLLNQDLLNQLNNIQPAAGGAFFVNNAMFSVFTQQVVRWTGTSVNTFTDVFAKAYKIGPYSAS